MRVNQPVTQREYPFPGGRTLVTTTDPDSRITYANDAFLEVSGFEGDELIGQYHNVIRHPDMPQEAFRDMWDTLGTGRPWRAMVKNRRKDGDHYWVKANVTPLYRDGTVSGYLSVRTEPTRAEVDGADALYRRMREEAEHGRVRTRLHRGRVERSLRWATWREKLLDSGILPCFGYPVAAVAITSVMMTPTVRDAVGVAGTVLALASLVAWQAIALRQRMVRPFESVRRLTARLAGGDLGVQLDERETRRHRALFQTMEQLAANLRGVVGDVRNVAGEVSGGTSGIARAMNDISERTLSQASSLQQTSAAMESMTGTISSNAAGAQQVGTLAREVEETATSSNEAMTRVVETMNEIHTASQRIEEILSVINTLAFQTNLLALNASVEAARAGEQGRGFSVVASEVRNLAQQSAESADKIRDLVTVSSEAVTGGLAEVRQAHERVVALRSSIQEVSAAIGRISEASGEQAAGVQQINAAVSELDSANQVTTHRIDSSLHGTRRLEQESRRLMRAVGVFVD